LAISQFVRQSMLDGGIPDSKIYTALNSTDPVEFDPDKVVVGSFRKQLGVKEETPLIGIVARVMFWKGHKALIEAFAEVKKTIPDAVLAIIGKELGTFGDELRARIKELGLEDSVHWAGWFDESAPIFADLDVVCVPSWEEPFGLVVTEALAMRRAVVGYASGALPEIISDGKEGQLVPPGDIPVLAEAIRALLKDPLRRREYGYAGRERVIKQFTPQRQAHEVADIYRQICRPSSVVAASSRANAA
jgi:glycosyltransferase involved in cell wall biosynthesis